MPADISVKWSDYINEIQCLDRFCVQRQVLDDTPGVEIQLHRFCDASEHAYAACVYVRSFDTSGTVKVQLLHAKTKVAPIKTISIPSLELCGAQLLTQLVKTALNIKLSKIYY